jgi:hypothetical protein
MGLIERALKQIGVTVVRPAPRRRPAVEGRGLTETDAIRIMREVGNHALADEMQRGLDRRRKTQP